jgi:3-dehydroquinate synthase
MRLEVESRSHTYIVETAPDLHAAIQTAEKGSSFVLADGRVRDLYPGAFSELERQSRLLTVPATEEQKTYESLAPVFNALIERGLRRNTRLCVVGGGVIQDIGCFIASVLYRGLSWDLIPTTLLAQCDSCIGSKSSLNIGSYKNQLGTFYPPQRVMLVFSVLRTLSHDDIRSGLGEAIKLHLLAGEDAFCRLKERLLVLPTDPVELEPVIMDSLLVKKAYIEKDEFDRNIRNLLNYGHTFGHAYESTTRYAIPHGISVTLGISTATYVSERLGLVPVGYFDSIDTFLKPYYEPYHQHLCSAAYDAIQSSLAKDKKNTGNELTCILTRGEGRMEKCTLNLASKIMPLIEDWRKKLEVS